MLVVLITMLGPISGAHFNPVVTGVTAFNGELSAGVALAYVAAQAAGGVAGTVLAHAMFELAPLTIGVKPRTGLAQWLAEAVATAGLLLTILLTVKHRPGAIAAMVGLYITAAYWFTASTSFANPAVTLARAFTTTFSGIAISDLPGFVVAQIVGALLGWGLARALSK
jgi:glycerol uptake facilitator-like aquaporin